MQSFKFDISVRLNQTFKFNYDAIVIVNGSYLLELLRSSAIVLWLYRSGSIYLFRCGQENEHLIYD